MTFVPRFQAREDRAVVWLVGIGDYAIPANGLKRFDTFGFRENVFNFFEDFTGTRQRCAWRQLHVDAKDALVLVRNKSRWDRFSKKSRTQYNHANDGDGDDSPPHQHSRDVNVPIGRDVKHLIEAAEENAQWSSHGFG